MSPRPLARAARLCCRGGGTRWARLRFHLGADGRVVDRVVTEGEILADGRGKVAARPVQQCVLDVLEVRELEPRQVDRGEMTVLRELDRQDRVGEGVAREDRDTLLEAGGIQDVRLVDDGRPDDRTKTWRTRRRLGRRCCLAGVRPRARQAGVTPVAPLVGLEARRTGGRTRLDLAFLLSLGVRRAVIALITRVSERKEG